MKRYVRQYRKRNPARYRRYDLKRNFGITPADYDRLLNKQKGVCAACRCPEIRKGNHGKVKRLSVDHNHKTGKARGLLCSDCNTALGLLKEDLTRINGLAEYVVAHEFTE